MFDYLKVFLSPPFSYHFIRRHPIFTATGFSRTLCPRQFTNFYPWYQLCWCMMCFSHGSLSSITYHLSHVTFHTYLKINFSLFASFYSALAFSVCNAMRCTFTPVLKPKSGCMNCAKVLSMDSFCS